MLFFLECRLPVALAGLLAVGRAAAGESDCGEDLALGDAGGGFRTNLTGTDVQMPVGKAPDAIHQQITYVQMSAFGTSRCIM